MRRRVLNNTRAYPKQISGERVQCPNCHMIYQKPDGPLQAYHCARCGHSPLVPLMHSSTEKQAGLAMAGALVGAGLAGIPGAIVGGIIGLLAGSGESE